jgi:hypothetical protein
LDAQYLRYSSVLGEYCDQRRDAEQHARYDDAGEQRQRERYAQMCRRDVQPLHDCGANSHVGYHRGESDHDERKRCQAKIRRQEQPCEHDSDRQVKHSLYDE